MRGLGLPLINRHLGVCGPPPVASLQCRQPAHPLVSFSMGCWIAGCWRANAFSIRLQLVQAPGSRAATSSAAPMVGASPDNIGAQRLAEGGVPASGAGSAQSRLAHLPVIFGGHQPSSQHRGWVRRPTTLERSEGRRAACPPAERAQQRSDEPTRRNQKDAKKNWNLTPISCPITAAASARCVPLAEGGWRRVCSGRR